MLTQHFAVRFILFFFSLAVFHFLYYILVPLVLTHHSSFIHSTVDRHFYKCHLVHMCKHFYLVYLYSRNIGLYHMPMSHCIPIAEYKSSHGSMSWPTLGSISQFLCHLSLTMGVRTVSQYADCIIQLSG